LASLVFYTMVLCGAGAVLARGKGFAVARRVPLIFAGIHFGFAWGFWREVWRQLRPVAKPQAV
jgi:succinoglycan biosynthesis protein ExoA